MDSCEQFKNHKIDLIALAVLSEERGTTVLGTLADVILKELLPAAEQAPRSAVEIKNERRNVKEESKEWEESEEFDPNYETSSMIKEENIDYKLKFEVKEEWRSSIDS